MEMIKMKNMTLSLRRLLACAGFLLMAHATAAQQPARVTPFAGQEMLLAATQAGQRVVAVGDHGVVLLADDGQRFRQAQSVPVRSTLTAVSFADAKHGWAVGHWGVILHTEDGGENWTVQRQDASQDRPFFAVHFTDARHGVAAGLWSLLMTTDDGGKTWRDVALPVPLGARKADRNLFAIFASGPSLFIAAERGLVLRSDDRGLNWRYLETGYAGSLWCGATLSDGVMLVGGLRGTIYRSADHGKTWAPVSSGAKSAITAIAQSGDKVLAVGLDGVVAVSADGGLSFQSSQRADRLALTGLVGGRPLGLSKRGVLLDLLKGSNE